MRVYVLGAGASVNAGYPLASQLLYGLSTWLDACDPAVYWVPFARNRIVQVRETFTSLDDFEEILGQLEGHGQQRVKPTGPTTYMQDPKDLLHDCTEQFGGADGNDTGSAIGFYPQYLRSDLISAIREWFYEIEKLRAERNAYDCFAEGITVPNSSIITFNYDIAPERALAKVGKWDIGRGYGFPFLPDRSASKVIVYKLHGSVNWFKGPVDDLSRPVIFPRDLCLLGYDRLIDPKIGRDGMAVDNPGTFILPDPRKKFYWERFWEPLWNGAVEHLRAASEVFIHGYSMPMADVRARQLLFGNIEKSVSISIHCRSSSNRIADEFHARGFVDVQPFPDIDFEDWTSAAH